VNNIATTHSVHKNSEGPNTMLFILETSVTGPKNSLILRRIYFCYQQQAAQHTNIITKTFYKFTVLKFNELQAILDLKSAFSCREYYKTVRHRNRNFGPYFR
jgi:hypothetical protein